MLRQKGWDGMFREELPDKKIGYLLPRNITENQAYEFYRLAPPGIMLVLIPCGLAEFSAGDVARVFKSIDQLLDQLMERDVDIVIQAGVPLPILIGMEAHDALIKHIADYTGRPAVSQIQNVMVALNHLGVKKALVANKWTDAMNATMAEFFARDGITITGVCNKVLAPAEFSRIGTDDSAQMAYELGIQGFKDHPEADGLYIGGGSWLSQPVSEQIEGEVGKPVVGNHGATLWHLLNQLDKWQPIDNHGRLLAMA
jgi:maleate cis-trans isomerase